MTGFKWSSTPSSSSSPSHSTNNISNNSETQLQTFDDLEAQKERYFKHKTIEIYKLQEARRSTYRHQVNKQDQLNKQNLIKKQQDIIKQNELDKQREIDSIRHSVIKKGCMALRNEFIETRVLHPQLHELESHLQSLNNSNSNSMNNNSININKARKHLKKRLTQLSFNKQQTSKIIQEISQHFGAWMLPVIFNSIRDTAVNQISSHTLSYEIYSSFLFNLFNTTDLQRMEVMWSFFRKRIFLRPHTDEVFRSLVLIHLGYLSLFTNSNNSNKDSNKIKEALDLLEQAVIKENRGSLSLMVMECFFIVFNKYLKDISKECSSRLRDIYGKIKQDVYPLINNSDEGLRCRVDELFKRVV